MDDLPVMNPTIVSTPGAATTPRLDQFDGGGHRREAAEEDGTTAQHADHEHRAHVGEIERAHQRHPAGGWTETTPTRARPAKKARAVNMRGSLFPIYRPNITGNRAVRKRKNGRFQE